MPRRTVNLASLAEAAVRILDATPVEASPDDACAGTEIASDHGEQHVEQEGEEGTAGMKDGGGRVPSPQDLTVNARVWIQAPVGVAAWTAAWYRGTIVSIVSGRRGGYRVQLEHGMGSYTVSVQDATDRIRV
jgi:hypothetical protein